MSSEKTLLSKVVLAGAETLYDDGLVTMIGQIGQSNNLTLARLMMKGVKDDYMPQSIVGSKQGLTLIINFEGKDKRITISDVEIETQGEPSEVGACPDTANKGDEK